MLIKRPTDGQEEEEEEDRKEKKMGRVVYALEGLEGVAVVAGQEEGGALRDEVGDVVLEDGRLAQLSEHGRRRQVLARLQVALALHPLRQPDTVPKKFKKPQSSHRMPSKTL